MYCEQVIQLWLPGLVLPPNLQRNLHLMKKQAATTFRYRDMFDFDSQQLDFTLLGEVLHL